MASDFIVADMVESSEFNYLAIKYNVQGVPHTVVNETHSLPGLYSEDELAKAILKTIGK